MQIFESFGSALPPALFDRLSLEPIRRMVEGLKAARPGARVIVFVRGGGANLHRFASAGVGDGLALDWTLDPARVLPTLPEGVADPGQSRPAGADRRRRAARPGHRPYPGLGSGSSAYLQPGTRHPARELPSSMWRSSWLASEEPAPDMVYLWIKAFHVIAVISWMAGMLYLPRLFVYHSETPKGLDPVRYLQDHGKAPPEGDHQPRHGAHLGARPDPDLAGRMDHLGLAARQDPFGDPVERRARLPVEDRESVRRRPECSVPPNSTGCSTRCRRSS